MGNVTGEESVVAETMGEVEEKSWELKLQVTTSIVSDGSSFTISSGDDGQELSGEGEIYKQKDTLIGVCMLHRGYSSR